LTFVSVPRDAFFTVDQLVNVIEPALARRLADVYVETAGERPAHVPWVGVPHEVAKVLSDISCLKFLVSRQHGPRGLKSTICASKEPRNEFWGVLGEYAAFARLGDGDRKDFEFWKPLCNVRYKGGDEGKDILLGPAKNIATDVKASLSPTCCFVHNIKRDAAVANLYIHTYIHVIREGDTPCVRPQFNGMEGDLYHVTLNGWFLAFYDGIPTGRGIKITEKHMNRSFADLERDYGVVCHPRHTP
jgi:hypothetical protein